MKPVLNEVRSLASPLFIAHRGFKSRYPENTLSAFRGAVEAGARMMELDVTLTADRQVAVIHDDTLQRTTDGRGRVCDFTLEELKRLDAGAWLAPRFAGERIPTLAEVLDFANGRIAVNIEIKPEAFEPVPPADAIENQVLEMIFQRKMEASILISSFEHRVLERISSRKDAPVLGVLTERMEDPGEAVDFSASIGAFSWNPDFAGLEEKDVVQAHSAGLRVFPFTINRPRKMISAIRMGADGFFTDDPPLAGKTLSASPKEDGKRSCIP